jgi:hypothetical protein
MATVSNPANRHEFGLIVPTKNDLDAPAAGASRSGLTAGGGTGRALPAPPLPGPTKSLESFR